MFRGDVRRDVRREIRQDIRRDRDLTGPAEVARRQQWSTYRQGTVAASLPAVISRLEARVKELESQLAEK